jgi:hypothetical protein
MNGCSAIPSERFRTASPGMASGVASWNPLPSPHAIPLKAEAVVTRPATIMKPALQLAGLIETKT